VDIQPYSFTLVKNKAIIRSHGRICETTEELLTSHPFRRFLEVTLRDLSRRKSRLVKIFASREIDDDSITLLIQTLYYLTQLDRALIPSILPGSEVFFAEHGLLEDFVEYLYNAWQHYDRFIIISTFPGEGLERRPYRTFNDTIERLTHLIRGAYRDILENITRKHPRVYRQTVAGADVATIGSSENGLDLPYEQLKAIPIVRQVLLYPPLVLDPPMNKRTGQFRRVSENPLHRVDIVADEWLGYPAKVGELTILVYIHEAFLELGLSLCNLFELASDQELCGRPDAIYLFGVPGDGLEHFGSIPTVFYDDQENDLLVAAVSQGLVQSYFANIFGPPQYRDLHERIARRYFEHFFASGLFVGQIRTRLGLPGWETKGPEEAARQLITLLETGRY